MLLLVPFEKDNEKIACSRLFEWVTKSSLMCTVAKSLIQQQGYYFGWTL